LPDSVTQKVFQYGEIETTRRVANREQKGLAGNLCFEIAAFSPTPDGRRRWPVGGSSAIQGGGVRLADNRIGSGSQTGCDTDSKPSLHICDADSTSNFRNCGGTDGARWFQGRVGCGTKRFPTTEFGGNSQAERA
jgi:hypothetical protein